MDPATTVQDKKSKISETQGQNPTPSESESTQLTIGKIKNATDLQRLKLDKLLKKHAENKLVFIPEPSKERKLREPLEFIRNIWGSSAGVGSGDFDVYRGIRRREYARQKFILGKSAKDDADEAYRLKVIQNQEEAEERTSKKRDKRQKKKQKWKANKKKKPNQAELEKEETESETDEEEKHGDLNTDENRVEIERTADEYVDETSQETVTKTDDKCRTLDEQPGENGDNNKIVETKSRQSMKDGSSRNEIVDGSSDSDNG